MPKQMVNKLIAQKSTCVDCGSKKSVFVKEYKLDKKQKQLLQIIKTCSIVQSAKHIPRGMSKKTNYDNKYQN